MNRKFKYIKNLLKGKYNHLKKVGKYDQCFSDNDGLYFYENLLRMGIFEPTKQEKQEVWSELLRTKNQWWTQKRQPEQFEIMNLCKSILFKNWIEKQAINKRTIDEIITI